MFKKAERQLAFAKLAITGVAGSGKTLSALMISKGLGGKTAVVDTENNSASLYADHAMLEGFEFDTAPIDPPYTTEKFNQAIDEAIKQGYENIILDSISHAWAGQGGLQDQKDNLDRAPKSNQWANWRPITAKHETFKAKMVHSKINLIATMRSKMEYAQTENGGKKTIKKMGLAPIQREGMEYEFTIVFDIGDEHFADVSKDRTGLFAKGDPFKISIETGEKIMAWLKGANPAPIVEQEKPPADNVFKYLLAKKVTPEMISAKFGVENIESLTEEQRINLREIAMAIKDNHPVSDLFPPAPKPANHAPGSGSENAKGPSEAQLRRLWALASKVGFNSEQIHDQLLERYNLKSSHDLNTEQYQEFTSAIEREEHIPF